jgi:hypothetical protein
VSEQAARDLYDSYTEAWIFGTSGWRLINLGAHGRVDEPGSRASRTKTRVPIPNAEAAKVALGGSRRCVAFAERFVAPSEYSKVA